MAPGLRRAARITLGTPSINCDAQLMRREDPGKSRRLMGCFSFSPSKVGMILSPNVRQCCVHAQRCCDAACACTSLHVLRCCLRVLPSACVTLPPALPLLQSRLFGLCQHVLCNAVRFFLSASAAICACAAMLSALYFPHARGPRATTNWSSSVRRKEEKRI